MSGIIVTGKGPPPLGRKLASRRVLLGIARSVAAKAVGIHPGSLTRIETGERRPSLSTLIALAELYDTSVDDLIRDTELAAVA